MVNRERPHILVLPEDGANRELANGFWLGIDPLKQRQMQVLPVAGGWSKTLDLFRSDHVFEMDRCPNRFLVLLIDLDGRIDRLDAAKTDIPARLAERVFILCTLTKPEELRADLGALEQIGEAMAEDCRQGSDETWRHRLLQHNAIEIARLRERVLPILFA